MIAMMIFAFFITVFVATQGENLNDSMRMRQELIMQQLCESKINEIIIDPPEFREALTLTKEQKTFEENEAFEYIIEYKRFEMPDLSKIKPSNKTEDGEDAGQSQVEKRIFDQVKDILKDAVWQVKVTVKEKETGFPFSLSTWLINENANVKFTY